MPKLKIRQSVVKRFRVTKNGKVLHRSSFRGHLRSHKSASQIRRFRKLKPLTTARAKKIKQALGFL